jgi:hypothetical protein
MVEDRGTTERRDLRVDKREEELLFGDQDSKGTSVSKIDLSRQ